MDIVGYIAATLTTVAFFPQAYKIYKTHEVKDLSLALFVMFSSGVFLWLVYGVMIDNLPMIVANSVTLVLALYILYMKITIEKNSK
jgi:MtN3 and saliva related transmembrane protein